MKRSNYLEASNEMLFRRFGCLTTEENRLFVPREISTSDLPNPEKSVKLTFRPLLSTKM